MNNGFHRLPALRTCLAVITVLLLVLLLSSCSDSPAQETAPVTTPTDLIINEVLASNTSSAKAYDGRYYDWVELYNPTGHVITLDEYYISDNAEQLQKTSLKGQTIPAHGYLLIYCSGLNITDEKGSLHTNFKLSAVNGETVYLSDRHSLSYLSVPVSKENQSYGLGPDGVTYGWFDEPTPGKANEGMPVVQKPTVRINEYMTSNTFTLYDCEGDCGDWAELYNSSSVSVDLSGWGLTDSDVDPFKYSFPEGTVIEGRGYLVVFCDGKNKTDSSGELHTGFSLGKRDGALLLWTSERQPAGRVPIYDMPANISCGWSESDKDYRFFAKPTPGRENSAKSFRELSADIAPDLGGNVIISEVLSASGSTSGKNRSDFIELFNKSKKTISLNGYTLSERIGEPIFTFPEISIKAGEYLLLLCDGSSYTEEQRLHIPVKINIGGETFYLSDSGGAVRDVFSTGKGRNGISSGRLENDTAHRYFFSTPTPGKPNSGEYYTAYAPVPKFSAEGGLFEKGKSVSLSVDGDYKIVYTTDGSEPTSKSEVYTSPITINENTVIRAAAFSGTTLMSDCVTQTYFTKNPHSLPVFCISGKPSELLGKTGIFRNQDNNAEVKIFVEYFDENLSKETQFPCGAALFGYSSRELPQKGVKLSLREIYGTSEVTYPFFSDNEKAVRTFSKLLLRPSGEDQIRSKLRDELVPALIRGQMDLDYQEFQACVLYVNGKYWGQYYIREHLGADYLYRYYGYQKGDYDLIKAQHLAQQGNLEAYWALTRFCEEKDLTQKKNYDYLCGIIDMESLINFWIVETYFGNTDTVNLRCYKHHDGKWRWMVYDMDWSMQINTSIRHKNFIEMHLTNPNGHGIGRYNNAIIHNLLQNEEFRTRFITAYCYHMNTTFAPDRAVRILDGMVDRIDEEIKLNEKRWGTPEYTKWSKTTVPYLRDFLMERPQETKKDLMESFQLSEEDWNRYNSLAKHYKPENPPKK